LVFLVNHFDIWQELNTAPRPITHKLANLTEWYDYQNHDTTMVKKQSKASFNISKVIFRILVKLEFNFLHDSTST